MVGNISTVDLNELFLILGGGAGPSFSCSSLDGFQYDPNSSLVTTNSLATGLLPVMAACLKFHPRISVGGVLVNFSSAVVQS